MEQEKIKFDQLAEALSHQEPDLSKDQAKKILTIIADLVTDEVANGKKVVWKNLATVTGFTEGGRWITDPTNKNNWMWRDSVVRPKFIPSENFKKKLKNN